MLASTTPAECIQERTASGSSFMLAVAPRGKLSWIPNISGASTLQPPPLLLPYNHESKTTLEKKQVEEEEEKSAEKRKVQQLYRTDRDLMVDVFFTNIETSRVRKQLTKRKLEETQKTKTKKTGEEEKICAGGSDSGV